ncbi:polysaccharide deacetylase family protein [Streptomyces sp. A7024]|uniref:Polysaccharide deacetylase family protein n=1 Tax=Streptomyces coryli TaxID=1128680 RepID=A0A6G4UDL2_9ACTN|nr:polysaccharide deacetylase family protein [Streptomyces coryli]NGN70243.1 polysaccharide deacetylase family protein [Streptomyces coryli]
MFHAVCETPAPAAHRLSVAPRDFAAQLDVIAAVGATPVTTAELATAWRDGSPLPRNPVVITFDDGYAGVHRHALPLLTKYGFPATVFAATGWLCGPYDTGGAPDTMLGWPQLRELAAAGVEIGGHSHTHPQLDQIPDPRLHFELRVCREIITAETGSAPTSFAYPFGYSDRRVRQAVRDAGFAQALAVENDLARSRQGPYALRRFTVRRNTTLDAFERAVTGRPQLRDVATDRALTRGYAVVRRSRQAVRKVRAAT